MCRAVDPARFAKLSCVSERRRRHRLSSRPKGLTGESTDGLSQGHVESPLPSKGIDSGARVVFHRFMDRPIPDPQLQARSGWDRVLLSLTVLTAVYGLAMVAAGTLVGDQLFDRLGFGPGNGGLESESQRSYARFIFGVLGSVIVGWMTLLGFITTGPFRRRERWSWFAWLSSIVVWFVLDTGMSLALGWNTHALFNVPFAVALATPILALRPRFL